ncbi:DUF5946 family protein [Ruminococcaceae bacterium OttesenSCG-928-N02]|nr:DUF5946 family protein [Ruminococcaceae bacterium OttesenSCG-928-N02]
MSVAIPSGRHGALKAVATHAAFIAGHGCFVLASYGWFQKREEIYNGEDMTDNRSVSQNGVCLECGGHSVQGLTCWQMMQYPLAWEHNDPKLYELHFWLVSCYMLQHPSNYTSQGHDALKKLFYDAYKNDWQTSYILKANREMTRNMKITNPIPNEKRKRKLVRWPVTIRDIYAGGEACAISNILKWRDSIYEHL